MQIPHENNQKIEILTQTRIKQDRTQCVLFEMLNIENKT